MLFGIPISFIIIGGIILALIILLVLRIVLAGRNTPEKQANRLMARGQVPEAARVLVAAGHHQAAVDILMNKRRFAEAAKVFLHTSQFEKAGELFSRVGDLEAATNAYLKGGLHLLAAAQQEKAGLLEDAGDSYAAGGNLESALRMYASARQYHKAAKLCLNHGDKQKAAGFLAMKFMVEGDMEQAAKHFMMAGQQKKAAEALLAGQEFPRAAALFEKLGDYRSAARARLQAGDSEQAAVNLEKVGDVQGALRLYEAAKAWNKLVDLHKRHGNWAALGNIMMRLEQADHAIEFFKRITPLEDDYIESAMSMASILESQGDLSGARKKYLEILEFRGVSVKTSQALFALAKLCERTGVPQEVLPFLRRLDATGPVGEMANNWVERLEHQVVTSAKTMMTSIEVASEEDVKSGKLEFVLPEKQTIADRYDMIDKIGQGGNGVIYKAFDKVLGREVVLKFLFKNQVPDDLAKRYFLREAKTTASLNHPNIVTLFDMGQVGENLYLSMEFIQGITLEEKLQRSKGLLDLDYIGELIPQICDSLQYAHDKTIIHRDIKPANIMLTGTGHQMVKLMDFGLAKALDENPNKTLIICGTPLYMSPEQIVGDFVNHLSDIYSLGVVVYQMLTGQTPFPPENILAHHQFSPAAHPTSIRPEIPVEAGDVVLKALAKKREDRFQRVEEFGQALIVGLAAGTAHAATEMDII